MRKESVCVCTLCNEWSGAALTASVNSAVVHCTLQGFIARLVVRADKGRRAVWTYQVHGGYNITHDDAPRGRLCYACLLHLHDDLRRTRRYRQRPTRPRSLAKSMVEKSIHKHPVERRVGRWRHLGQLAPSSVVEYQRNPRPCNVRVMTVRPTSVPTSRRGA